LSKGAEEEAEVVFKSAEEDADVVLAIRGAFILAAHCSIFASSDRNMSGFATKSFMPACWHSRRSLSMADAVMAMIVGGGTPGDARDDWE
jgi:hypothetical protein